MGWRSEVLLEEVQFNFSFRKRLIIFLPCGLLLDNNTFSKMCDFKSLTGCADGGYVVIIIIIKSKALKSLCWLF